MTHLNDSEFIDLVEGRLAADRSRHAAACDACRAQADGIRDALTFAHRDAVPDPSPLFWTHFSARVSAAIGRERRPSSAWTLCLREGGLEWAFAVLVVLLVAGVAWRTVGRIDQSPLPEMADMEAAGGASSGEYLLDDSAADAWDAIVVATDDLQIEETETLGIRVRPGAAERMAEELTPEERLELARLIEDEIKRTGA